MTRHVIILAQGQQTRLPDLKVPKQLLEIWPGKTIIQRTVQQVREIDPNVLLTVVCPDSIVWGPSRDSSDPLALLPFLQGMPDYKATSWWSLTTLPEPGNSSLKGLAQVLDRTACELSSVFPESARGCAGQTVILLGDTVYSWDCIKTLFWTSNLRESTNEPGPDLTFVTTSDLTPSGGEVWGVSWPRSVYTSVRGIITAAIADHPPFTSYQPGQLRRMIKHAFTFPISHQIIHVDDYTRDIDVPAHVAMLPELAVKAREDDRKHEWQP